MSHLLSFLLPADSDDFPPPESATEGGLLAIGSNLQPETLLKAYRLGTFPWYNADEPIMWHHPDPRMVLFPKNLVVSHSMRNVMNKKTFSFSMNTSFEAVIERCRDTKRKGDPGTWITDEIITAYVKLHRLGYAISAEAWQHDTLCGGLYGVLIGKVFYGESMFADVSNASKFAFIRLVHQLQKNGVELIDCQTYTTHLESLGAAAISRKSFVALLNKLAV